VFKHYERAGRKRKGSNKEDDLPVKRARQTFRERKRDPGTEKRESNKEFCKKWGKASSYGGKSDRRTPSETSGDNVAGNNVKEVQNDCLEEGGKKKFLTRIRGVRIQKLGGAVTPEGRDKC